MKSPVSSTAAFFDQSRLVKTQCRQFRVGAFAAAVLPLIRLVALGGMLLIIATGIFLGLGVLMTGSREVKTETEREFLSARPNRRSNTVFEVTAADHGSQTFSGRLLERKGQSYFRTVTSARTHWTITTRIQMGGLPDIHPGAIIYVTGFIPNDRERDLLEAEQLVILTRYVQPEEPIAK